MKRVILAMILNLCLVGGLSVSTYADDSIFTTVQTQNTTSDGKTQKMIQLYKELSAVHEGDWTKAAIENILAEDEMRAFLEAEEEKLEKESAERAQALEEEKQRIEKQAALEAEALESALSVWDFENGRIQPSVDEAMIDAAYESVLVLDAGELKTVLLSGCRAADHWLENGIEPQKTDEEILADANLRYYGNCRITFYCNGACCCGVWAGGGTASGTMPTEGRTIANGDLPFGTKVLIEGHVYTVEDRGVGAQQIDVFLNSHAECDARGLYYTDVYIVE